MRSKTKRMFIFLLTVAAMPCVCPPHSAWAAGKVRIAVSAFENRVKGIDESWDLGEGMAEMLTTELTRTGRFMVLERSALGDVIEEQSLGQSGLMRPESAAKSGQMMGAQVIIRGAVTEFSDAASGAGGGARIKGFGISGKSEKAYIGIDVRVINARTGQVMASTHAAREAASGGGRVSYATRNFQIGGGGFSSTPLGIATRAAISDAVSFITRTMARYDLAPKLRIVKVKGSRIYINAGANSGMAPGVRLHVYSEGESLIDPETGLDLGSSEEQIGLIEITTVREKFSIATPVSGHKFRRGNLLKNINGL